jgi:hypothetical protein
LRKSARKCARISVLARALVMIAKNLVIFPNIQLAGKYAHIYALIHASGIQALTNPKIVYLLFLTYSQILVVTLGHLFLLGFLVMIFLVKSIRIEKNHLQTGKCQVI